MEKGWIKIHRKLLDSDIGSMGLETIGFAIYLILKANFKDSEFNGIKVKRGQLLTTRSKLCQELKIADQPAKTLLSRLEATKFLTRKTTNKNTIITIQNYNKYQITNQQINQQTNQQKVPKTTNDQQTKKVTPIITYKNDKEEVYKKKNMGLNKSNRKKLSFKKEDYNKIIDIYQKLKGITLQGNEFLPIQQTIKTMLMSDRTPDQIISCMYFLADDKFFSSIWTIKTVRLKLPEFLAGKLKKIEPDESSPLYRKYATDKINGLYKGSFESWLLDYQKGGGRMPDKLTKFEKRATSKPTHIKDILIKKDITGSLVR